MSDDLARLIETSSIKSIPSRKINAETCRKFDYRVRLNSKGEQEHIAVYRDLNGVPQWAKIRNTGTPERPKKDFTSVGKTGDLFYGQWLWAAGGKRLTIVGGELDLLTVSMVQDNQWPVVSPPKGEQSLDKFVTANLQWVSSFDEVCIGTDMDQPGREAALKAAKLLPPGKAKIVVWSRKDPNEMLLNGEGKDIIRCIWNAERYTPGGMVDARNLTAECLVPPTMGMPWPWRFMTQWTLGRRYSEHYTFGSGTGMGKSDFLAEIIAADLQGKTRDGQEYEPQGWAIFCYEGGAATYKNIIAGKIAQRLFQYPQGHPDCHWTPEEHAAAHALMDGPLWDAGGKLFILETGGAADWDTNMENMRYLRHAENIRHNLTDPIGALVIDEEDERKFLDKATLESAHLADELQSCNYFVSHLTRPSEGKSHEEGGRVILKQFRGSNGIGMYSSFVMGLERNQQADTLEERCTTTLRCVKDRKTGSSTGKTQALIYDQISGTLDVANTGLSAEDAALC
jgi:twinkle protein